MARYITKENPSTISAAVADGMSELQSLRDEVREVADNASGTALENTQRIQTLSETADTLDSYVDDEPDAPAFLADLPTKYTTTHNARKGRGDSRATRHDNAINALRAAADEVASWLEDVEGNTEGKTEEEREEMKDAAETYKDAIEEVVDNLDGAVEYPGMFG
jgi:ABC-type transporter Mla subunit MlaD